MCSSIPTRAAPAIPGTSNVVVGMEQDFPPYSFVNDRGEPEGFNVDLVKSIARTMRFQIEIKTGSLKALQKLLRAGEIDLLAGMYYSIEKENIFDFSPAFTIIHHAVFSRTSSKKVNSVQELRGRELIVKRDDVMYDYILRTGLSDHPVPTETQIDAIRLLAQGKHDYALVDKLPGLYWCKELGLANIRITGESFWPEQYCFAISEGNHELLDNVNQGLSIIENTGQLDQIKDSWLAFGETRSTRPHTLTKYTLLISSSLIVLLAISIFWSWSLKRQVRERTIDLGSEIVERQLAERQAGHKTIGISAINRLLLESMDCQTEQEIIQKCLNLAEELTGSSFGFIGEVDDIDRFSIKAMSLPEKNPNQNLKKRHNGSKKGVEINGIWEQVIKQGDVLMLNEPVPLTEFDNMPKACPPIESLLAVPLLFKGTISGLIVLANKETGFDAVDREVVETLVMPFVTVLNRRRVEDNLRDSHEKYRELLETITDGFAVLDQHGCFIYGSPKLGRMLGLDHEQLLGESIGQYMNKRNNEKMIEYLSHRPQKSDGHIEVTWVDQNSHNVNTLISSRPMFDEYGWLIGSFAAITNVTELKRAKRTLVDVFTQLNRSNQELEQFAYVASHDLQEPLRKITFFGYHLKKTYSDKLDEEGREYLDRMENAATRMKKLISSLLEFSRVTTKAQPFGTVDLKEVVEEVLSDLELRIEETGAKITIGDLPTLSADRIQMRQVFQNLIQNALKFQPDDNLPRVHIDSHTTENQSIQIIVEDNGIGFDEKYLERILKPFQRLHTRSEFTGVGMGLSICDKIVARHGGSLSARSELGKGTAFIITIQV